MRLIDKARNDYKVACLDKELIEAAIKYITEVIAEIISVRGEFMFIPNPFRFAVGETEHTLTKQEMRKVREYFVNEGFLWEPGHTIKIHGWSEEDEDETD